ncbi:carbohydrate ABC transporter permease [Paenibacillus cremeus]|uniref:Carbohydrate ABC transporter permease n=2 Tax=Paenibacillus cremeus TaxID=2163881 RepID=A0A559KGH3_9BACL|nr:carbohydrate ABC transporter permease [Paenibacillus cremeus]
MIYPLLWMLVSSFKDNTEIFVNTSLIPKKMTFDNYVQGWAGLSGFTFGRFFLNTFFLVGMCIVGTLISCSMAAYAFARLSFFMKKVFFAIMLMTLMLPFHVTVIPQYIMFNKFGWINSYWPLILPKFLGVEAFFIFLIVQFIRSLPRELDQAAEIDGCGPIKMYWYLIIPLTVPALMTTSIFTFIWTWNDFFSQLLYVSEIRMFPVALALRMFTDSMGDNSWGALFAMSILSLVPVFAVFIFFQRYLIEGISTGGLKG